MERWWVGRDNCSSGLAIFCCLSKGLTTAKMLGRQDGRDLRTRTMSRCRDPTAPTFGFLLILPRWVREQ